MAARWRRCTGGGDRLLSRNFLLDWRFGDNLRISPLKHKREWSFPLKTKGLYCKPRSRSLQMNANRAQGYGYLCNVIIGAVVSRKWAHQLPGEAETFKKQLPRNIHGNTGSPWATAATTL